MRIVKFFLAHAFALISLSPTVVLAQEPVDQERPIVTAEKIQVTITRIPEAVEPEPASITIVTGDQLRGSGADELASALALVSGVSIGLGGDGGPASSVPELWGLREFDAFLLVVDNVPWGGAFNPALATVDLNDIERIEILRGAAPVMYGATSFVGVIHVIHRAASASGDTGRAYVGNYSTGGGAGRIALPSTEQWRHAVSFSFDSKGYRDDRTGYDRGHVLYRGETDATGGLFHFDADLTFLRQDPASPHPRTGAVLSPLVPFDSNHNPSDSKQNENRFHFVGGYEHELLGSDWALLAALTHADRNITKGFLTEVSNSVDLNAAGYRQDQDETDLYIDTHFVWKAQGNLHLILGADHLFGKAKARSENFDYFVNLDGTAAPNSFDEPVREKPQLEDERNFFGLYGQLDWNLTSRWLFQTGLRLNSTHEKREGEVLRGDAEDEEEELGEDSRSTNRLSGVAGLSFLAWNDEGNNVWIFGDYRNSFKPAAIDFGPEAEGEILEPETAQSWEGGIKGEMFHARFDWEATFFHMDFSNLVTSDLRNGLPVLINTGKQRFTGFEVGSDLELGSELLLQLAYSHHSAKFRDFVQVFDEVPTQLKGNSLEMSPDNLAAVGVVYDPPAGVIGFLRMNYVGERFLNKRNTAPADAFVTLAAGAGYKFGRNVLRLDVANLNNARDPISESELGDAQYYRQPARNFRLGWYFDL